MSGPDYEKLETRQLAVQKMRRSEDGRQLLLNIYAPSGFALIVAQQNSHDGEGPSDGLDQVWNTLVKRWNDGAERLTKMRRTDGEPLGDGDVHLQTETSGGFTLATLVDMDDGDVIVLTEDAIRELHRCLGELIEKEKLR